MHDALRARLRALALAFVIGVHGLMAAPLPHRTGEAQLQRPEGREELGRWVELLGRLGYATDVETLGARVMEVSNTISSARWAVVRPLWPIRKISGTGQGWALFAAPDTHPSRLEIHARVDGAWRPVFRRLDPDHDLLEPQLSFRRTRGVYDNTGLAGPYGHLARWAAAEVLAAVPEADAVRIRLVRLHATVPGAPPDRKERARQELVVERTP